MTQDFIKIWHDSSIGDVNFRNSFKCDNQSSTCSFYPLCTDQNKTNCYPFVSTLNPGLYHFETVGAKGCGQYGGNGARAVGDIKIFKPLKLYLFVGTMHGFNGGGKSTLNDNNGGGSSDIRLLDTSSSDTSIQKKSLISRIIVAAGGGGVPHG